MSHSARQEPLVRILWDTNLFVSLLVFQSESLNDYLDKLIYQHEHGLIQLIVPKAVQAELYGILQAGRVKRSNQPVFLSHEQILYLLEPYLDLLFDRDYLNQLGKRAWPSGEAYKELLKQLLAEEYGWHDFGQAYIERRLRHTVEMMGLLDRYDFPIMASALFHGVDLIVTHNMQDFIDPLGKIRVMNFREASRFDHFELHLPYESWEDPVAE
ncbi:PIN domain-containing protein [Cohnella fermenti]|uniref:PIN domain-containing protein n=1 Tax=Cohnella fermenti TaxID=2565925 RepID=A0A4S4C8U0_9BACL|nr:PIN domain-containing protein [Cohnella fermenti]THF84452.1 PIN domain-containing protein [Cohnella fermenti]